MSQRERRRKGKRTVESFEGEIERELSFTPLDPSLMSYFTDLIYIMTINTGSQIKKGNKGKNNDINMFLNDYTLEYHSKKTLD